MMLFLWFGLLNLVAADEYNRNDFPPEFVFGASTSAYQVPHSYFNKYLYVYILSYIISN